MCAAGFLQQFAGVCRPDMPEKNMSSVIEQLSGGRIPTRVLCCGHSLGGALATLGMPCIAAVYDISVLVRHCSLASLLLRDRPLPASRGLVTYDVLRMCLQYADLNKAGIGWQIAVVSVQVWSIADHFGTAVAAYKGVMADGVW